LPLSEFTENASPVKKHLSHSQISAYQSCPMVYYFRYEKGIKTAPAAAMVFGTSIHSALEHNFSQKVLSHRDVPASVALDVFRDSWKAAAITAVFDAEKNESPEAFLEQGLAMIDKYMEEMAPNIQPKYVELRFTLNVPGLDRDVVGYIDLVDENDVIIDHKTTKMTPNNLTLAKNNQLVLYRMAYRKRYGRDPSGLRYDYLIRKTNRDGSFKGVEILPIPIHKTEANERALIETYIIIEQAMALKQYYPNPSHFGCTPSGCGYWNDCMGKILAGEKVPAFDDIREMQKKAYKKLIETGSV
jgi:RecB family exonuclease